MIRKIKKEEYLKGYGTMSDGERKGYWSRVGEWLADSGRRLLELTDRPMAKAQNIVLLSARWKEQEAAMFAEGARLLSALMEVADTWLPTQLYAKSAYRAVRNMVGVMLDAYERAMPVGTVVGDFVKTVATGDMVGYQYVGGKQALVKAAGKGSDNSAGKPQGAVGATLAGKPASTVAVGHDRDAIAGEQTKKPLPMIKTVSREYDPATDTVRVQCAVVPAEAAGMVAVPVVVRPKHIDQYVHLLPKGTQERAAQYGPLKREIEAARENMRLLMNDPNSRDDEREKWAKLATRNDEKIARINAELDREWDNVAATGRVVMDDLGMAHLRPVEGGEEPDEEPSGTVAALPLTAAVTSETKQEPTRRKPGRPAMTEEEKKAAAEKKAAERAAASAEKKKAEDDKRREYLKKWLRDTRTNPSEERRKQWEANCKELVALGGEVTESIRKAGAFYGVELDGAAIPSQHTEQEDKEEINNK